MRNCSIVIPPEILRFSNYQVIPKVRDNSATRIHQDQFHRQQPLCLGVRKTWETGSQPLYSIVSLSSALAFEVLTVTGNHWRTWSRAILCKTRGHLVNAFVTPKSTRRLWVNQAFVSDPKYPCETLTGDQAKDQNPPQPHL